MDAPRIQYARTADGVNIAYYVLGNGPPLVHLVPHVVSHLMLGWRVPTTRSFFQRLAEHMTVIALDWRGCGLSGPWINHLTLDMLHADVAAVLDRLGVRRVNLCAWGLATGYALAFAAKYPERVLRLVVCEASGRDSELRNAIVNLSVDASPSVSARTLAAVVGGFSDANDVAALAALHAEACPAAGPSFLELARVMDLAPLLPLIQSPALFVHAADDPLMPLAHARSLVTAMPDAVLEVVPGNSPLSVQGSDDAGRAILDFLLAPRLSERAEVALSSTAASPLAPRQMLGQQPGPGYHPNLSRRQTQVLQFIAMGKTNREIAEELVLSLRTVERHIADLYERIGVRNRTEAVAFALNSWAIGQR